MKATLQLLGVPRPKSREYGTHEAHNHYFSFFLLYTTTKVSTHAHEYDNKWDTHGRS